MQTFAADRLRDPHVAQRRYAEHFAQRVEQRDADADSPPPRHWLEAIEQELVHLRAALNWFLQHDPGERPLQLAVALGPFWLARSAIREGSRWVETALQHAPTAHDNAPVDLRARALLLLGELCRMQGDLPAAKQYFEQSGALLLHVREDEAAYADVLFNLGILAGDQNDYQAAETYLAHSLSLFQQYRRPQRAGAALTNLGRIVMTRGDNAAAQQFYSEAAAMLRVTGDREQLGWLLINLGSLRALRGDYAAALRDIDDSLEAFDALGNRNGIAWASYRKGTILAEDACYPEARAVLEHNLTSFEALASAMGITMTHNKLTSVALAQHDTQRAWYHAGQSLHRYQEMQHQMGLGLGIEHVAILVAAQDARLACRLLGCAEKQLALLRPRIAPIDQPHYEHTLSTLRAQLGEASFTAAWEEGRVLPLDEAVQLALQLTDRSASDRTRSRAAASQL